jgi:RNA polymerase sigma factor (sigma-70 family)
VDKELLYIREIIEGDTARYAWFVDTYKDMAFAIAHGILANEQDSEEAVQDAFLQAYRNLRTFKGESRFSTWLYRIVVNNSLSRMRKKQRERSYADIELAAAQLAEVESSYAGLTPQEQGRVIGQAMEQLRPEDRLVLTLYYLDERSLGEIEEITGIPKVNVKMQLHRARGRMYGVLRVLLNRKINTL